MKSAHDSSLNALKKIRNAGFAAYFAGGAVRDQLLGRTPKDYDIATSARPDQIENLFPKTVAIGKAFGVIIVVQDQTEIEVATFREDTGYQDGRRPDSVLFCGAEEDAKRRDFTVNGMFYDPISDEIIDYVNGQEDLKKKVIRAIGAPERRFAEDHLRILRAVRFAHTLDFTITPTTREAIKKHASDLSKISIERIENEFSRILVESLRPGDALAELADLGLIEHIIPEILPMIGQEQPLEFHPEGDVFEHTVLMLNLMTNPTRTLAYSVLLHDVGKPDTAFRGKDRIRFHGHESRSAEMAKTILHRLHLPLQEIKQIITAVAGHMRFKDVQEMNRSTLRRMMGAKTFDLELELHRLDCTGSHGQLDKHTFLLKKAEEMKDEPTLPERWVSGKDLIQMGIQPGPRIGDLLKTAYDAQLEERFKSRNELISWLKTERRHE